MRPIISSVLASAFFGIFLLAGCIEPLGEPAPELEAPLSFHGEGAALAERFSLDRDGTGWLMEPVAADELEFDRVAMMIDAEQIPTLDARVSGDGGHTWSEWIPMTIAWSEDIHHTAHADLPHGGTHVQIRLSDLDPEQVMFMNLEAFVYGPEWSEWDFQGLPVYENELGLDSQTQALAANTGVDVTRSGWNARATRCSTRHTINRITVHHTVTPNGDSNMPARMRQMQNYHMDSLGWCDIGYHFCIGQDGKVYQARAETLMGAHVGNNNSNNGGVSFIGTYSTVTPSSGMMNAGGKIIRAIGQHYGFSITRTSVKGHREYNSTACPGQALYNKMTDLVNLANSGGGTTPPPTGNGTLRGAVFWGTNFDSDINDSSKRISGATVRLNTGATTTTDGSGNYSFSVAPGTYTVTASASGYSTESISRSVTSGNTSWGSIMLTKQTTTPTKGTLRGAIYHGSDVQNMANRISGATVRLNTGAQVTTDGEGWYVFEVNPGTYTVTASKSGYSTESLSRAVTSGEITWGSIRLTPQSSTGTLRGAIHHGSDVQNMANRISGATVRLNTGAQVTTDGEGWYVFEVSPGTYTVTASKSGYSTESLSRAVTSGEITWGSIRLTANSPAPDPDPDPDPDPEPTPTDPTDPVDPTPEPSDQSGVFGFVFDSEIGDEARIAGASIRIGDHQFVTDATGAFDLDLPAETYPLIVQADGYASFLGAVGVVSGSRMRLRIGLEPISVELENVIGITFPVDGEVLTENRALVLGNFDYDSVGSIEVNGRTASIDAEGATFAVELEFARGENVIEALLRDIDGEIVGRSTINVSVQGGALGCSTSSGSSSGAMAALFLLGLMAVGTRRSAR